VINHIEKTAPRSEEICRLNVLVNQVGYLTHGAKRFVVESNLKSLEPYFWLLDTHRAGNGLLHLRLNRVQEYSATNPYVVDELVYQGNLQPVSGDFGDYYVGDFSDFTAPGTYIVVVKPAKPEKPTYQSHLFTIADDVYNNIVEKGLDCFTIQRCGPSTTGYNTPCHLDDGIRADNGQFIDVVGGWHDATDLLKWTSSTITGMVGLLAITAHSPDMQRRARILEEVRWGNMYFLKMQDAAGYFYDHGIGGDLPEEGNHWTDNIRGTKDDRVVITKPGSPALQHLFITAQADLFRLYKDWDKLYAQGCLDAAVRCYQWVKDQSPSTYMDYGTGIYAGVSLYRTTGEKECLEYAIRMADTFAGLQHVNACDEAQGYFFQDNTRATGARHTGTETFALIGLCRFIEALRDEVDTSRWEHTIKRYIESYLGPFSALNAFGIVPYQVRLEEALLPGSREYKGCSYRYFMNQLHPGWWAGDQYTPDLWLGNNTNLAGNGIVLCYAARLFGSLHFFSLAQRMLDWILGVNPFNVSFVHGIGHQNPPEYIGQEYQPRTPKIVGSVMNGIAGDIEDRPDLQAGSYHTAEIWTPNTIQTMWLANELTQANVT
jgi:hypothetical protein